MKKLLRGILDFRLNVRPGVKDTFAKLALGQSPDALLVVCCDSRMAVNVFASTEPGDLLVIRNAGNIIPPAGSDGALGDDLSAVAVLEFGVELMNIPSIVVCGHSECGAIGALLSGREAMKTPHLRGWLAYAEKAIEPTKVKFRTVKTYAPQNVVSQRNVLLQLDNLRSHPFIAKRIKEGKLHLYGWWFDIAGAEVYGWDEAVNAFTVLDEEHVGRLLAKL